MADPITQVVQSLGLVTAYGYAKSKGYTGTEEEFAEAAAAIGQGAATATSAAEAASEDAETATTAAGTATTAAGNAENSATAALQYMNNAETAAANAGTAQTAAAGSATSAAASAQAAATSEYNAGVAAGASSDYALDSQDHAEDSEAWAVGTKNGTDVPSTAEQYNNNAKYYSDLVSTATGTATGAAQAAAASAAQAEAWATGGSGGTASATNNAEYWAGQAAASAEDAETAVVAGTAALANEAPPFSASTAYTAGEYVLYNNALYRFTADHAAGAWTGTDATAVKIGEEFGDLKSALSEVVVITDRPTSFDLVDGEYVNVSGVFTPYTGWSRTDYIDIGGLTSVKFESTASERSQYNFWYDSSKAPIGSRWNVNIGETTQIVPQNAKYMVLSGKTANMQKTAAYIGDKDTALVGTLPLTDAMKSEVEEMVGGDSADSYGLSSDALLYVDKVPTYYIDPASNPATYADAKPYLERKIAEIPSGKSMLFICDTHWPGNQKHSTQLMNFVRKRTGIENVLFGGDVYGNAASKFAAVKIMGQYLYQSRQAFGDKYIPTVGDHDNNTVNVSVIADAYVPYAQVAELFIGDIKRRYTCYQPSEKVAGMATGDTYNEIMEFFKTVYYVDDEKTQTRIIVLNCGNGGNYGALYDVFGTTGVELLRLQIPFLISSLYSTQENWNVCILSHKLEYGGTAPSTIQSLLSAFKTKRSYVKPSPAASGNTNIEAFWPYNTQYDFSGAPTLGFMYCLCGHTHTDVIKWSGYTEAGGSISRGNDYSGETLEQSTLGQIPYITTATDASANTEADGPTMTNGTVTEQCFDAITLVDDGLVFTRFGAGDNRRIYITA